MLTDFPSWSEAESLGAAVVSCSSARMVSHGLLRMLGTRDDRTVHRLQSWNL